MNPALTRTVVDTPVGPLTVVASEVGLRAVLWPDDDPARVPSASGDGDGDEDPDGDGDPDGDEEGDVQAAPHPILEQTRRQLGEYFAGERTDFDLPLDPVGTDFQRSAWDALRAIPFGTTVSYGDQAATMGDRNKARAVGAANGRNPISIIVPCHRVVGANGSLTGFAGGTEAKRFLLDHERRVAGATLL